MTDLICWEARGPTDELVVSRSTAVIRPNDLAITLPQREANGDR
jgi:hypothetical protein